MGYALTPTDCGGMAVIQVGICPGSGCRNFILPRDGAAPIGQTPGVPANGLPEVWEKLFGGGLSPSSDGDTGPQGTSPVGDGFSTADEYRGFIVSGKQIRTTLPTLSTACS